MKQTMKTIEKKIDMFNYITKLQFTKKHIKESQKTSHEVGDDIYNSFKQSTSKI